jgi:uncharacterized caspase-like protein
MKVYFSLLFFLLGTSIFSYDRYALIIGTNYIGNSAKITELSLAESDAQYLKTKLETGGKYEVEMLLGNQVTKDNINKAFDSISKKAKKDDVVVIYFSGHGTYVNDSSAPNKMRNYLVCYTRPHLSDADLDKLLNKINSPNALLIMDACFSGGIAKKGQKTKGAAEIPIPDGKDGIIRQNQEDFYFQNKPVISSSDEDQTSIEVTGNINHGVFTYHFGKAIESADLNKDKVVTALEAFFQARQETIKTAKSFQHDQTPQISGNASGILLSGAFKPIPQPNPPPPPVIPPAPIPVPEPVVAPAPPEPVQPVVEPPLPAEPVSQPPVFGSLLIKTTIVKDKNFKGQGMESMDDRMMKMKSPNLSRSVKIYIDDNEYPATLKTVSSLDWGATSKNLKPIPGEIYQINLKDIPAGVRKVTIKADDYHEYVTSVGITAGQNTELEIQNSIKGTGSIRGRVFYKTLDNPIEKHQVYFPTIVSVDGKQKAITDKDGIFYFTNLKPGKYQMAPSFMENLKIDDTEIVVKEGNTTKVDIILNVKLPSTKTRY